MKGLLFKNFITSRLYLFLILVSTLFITVFLIPVIANLFLPMVKLSVVTPESFAAFMEGMLGLPFFYSLCTCSEFFKADEKPATYSFFFSTPLSAKGLLQSKYYFLLLINLGILFICFLTDTVAMVILGEYGISCIASCVIYFSDVLILLSFIIPFHIRFGSHSSMEIQGFSIFLIFSLIVVYALFGDISFFFAENMIESLFEYLHSEKMIFIHSLIPYVGVLMYYLSYRISLVLYRKGIENYE